MEGSRTDRLHTHTQQHRKLLIRFDLVSSTQKNAEECWAKSHEEKGAKKSMTDKQAPLVYCRGMMRLWK